MRLARALGSLPHLRRQFVPTARSRVVRGRLQWNLNTGVEQPAQEVSSVDVKATLADQTPLASSLMLWATRVLIAGLVVVALIPNLILGVVFCAGYLLAELRRTMAKEAHRPSIRLRAAPSATANSNGEIATQTEAIARQFQHSHRRTNARDFVGQRKARSPGPDNTVTLTYAFTDPRIGCRPGPCRADSEPNAWSNFLAGRGRYPPVKVPHDHGQRQAYRAPVRSSDPGALITALARSVPGRGYYLAHCARWY